MKGIAGSIVIVAVLSLGFVGILSSRALAEGPNWNDPLKPNYIRGTRTDMDKTVIAPDMSKVKLTTSGTVNSGSNKAQSNSIGAVNEESFKKMREKEAARKAFDESVRKGAYDGRYSGGAMYSPGQFDKYRGIGEANNLWDKYNK